MSGDWDYQFLAGLAAYLAANSIGTWTGDAPLDTAGGVPLVLGALPDTPARVIGVTLYLTVDDPGSADTMPGVQFWIRGTDDPRTVTSIGSALFDLLHGAENLTLGGIPVAWCARASRVPQGRDTEGRLAESHNYYFNGAARPTAARPD